MSQKHGFQAKTLSGLGGLYGSVQPNYDNSKVAEIKKELGNFDYNPQPPNDPIKRVLKS